MTRYRFVEAESSRYPVAQVCRIAQVSRTAYYAWQDGQPSQRARDDADGEDPSDPCGIGRTVRRTACARRAAGPGA